MPHALPRPEALAMELEALGLPGDSAPMVSAELVVHHPVVIRVGVRNMAGRLRAAGMPEAGAFEAAALLFALEGFDFGHPLARVVEALEIAGVEHADAVTAGMQAARLHRETRRREPAARAFEVPVWPVALGLAAGALALALALLAG